MDLSRLSKWEKVAGGAAIALIASLFAPWWQIEMGGVSSAEPPGITAWDGYGGFDFVLLAAGIAVAVYVLMVAADNRPKLPVPGGIAVGGLGALLAALALHGVLNPPALPGSGAPEAPSSGVAGLFEESGSGFEAGIPGVIEISTEPSAASAEVVPVFAVAALVLAALIVLAGWRMTQPAGARSPKQAPATPVAARVAAMAAAVKPAKPPEPAASTTPATPRSPATPADRPQRMSRLMVGCGAAVAVSAFLPWGSVVGESLSGISWAWVGKVSLAMGLVLAAYGAQGLRGDRTVRHHGWAIAAVVVLLSTASIAWTTLDTLSLGGLVEPGMGLMITVVAGALAIWPLVVLRRSAKAAAAADGTTFIADERPETEAAV